MRDRISISIPSPLRRRVQDEAKRRGISVSRFLREAAEEYLKRVVSDRSKDPFFSQPKIELRPGEDRVEDFDADIEGAAFPSAARLGAPRGRARGIRP